MLTQALRSLGAEIEERVSKRELWTLHRAWRLAFAPQVSRWHGSLSEREWEAFEREDTFALSGARALDAYEAAANDSHAVLAAESLAHGPLLRCTFKRLPSYSSIKNAWRGDLYLMPHDLAWTFLVTHEQQFGPYFAIHPRPLAGC
jgi:hypothetical protein